MILTRKIAALVLWLIAGAGAQAQEFRMQTESDSLSWLVLETDSTSDRWRLPHPVYQFQTGDVDGNGSTDALVGVVKKTRFHRDFGRRLFIFKNYRGRVRPLWMGSKLGGELVDFRVISDEGSQKAIVRALETGKNGLYSVTDYEWEEFGLAFKRTILKDTNQETAKKQFSP
ncbi:MAG: hypothetical protein IJ605_05595 [Prevotella sp.]|nr:hypothetical protein [Prevotella sp.]